MPKNKKKFISRKNAVTFQVVHRSQQDPLTADENAPQHVLKEYSGKKNKEEEHKYGIFFDDEYDYTQHLKSIADLQTDWDQINYKTKSRPGLKKLSKSNVILPSSVFESEMEESVGLLNKAAPVYGPRPELDPDIVAAMDDDFDFNNPDNVLEDNFIELANQEGSECSEEEIDFADSEFEDEVGSLEGHGDFGEVETKSRFTDYSMTSSVIRRNEQLTLLDDHFENIFKTYNDSEIGSLPCEEIEGIVSTQDVELIKLAEKSLKNEEFDLDVKERTLVEASKDDSSEELEELVIKDSEKWDCESILSTYSNIYNHPAKICESKGPSKIKISRKTGLPMDLLGASKLTAHNLSLLNEYEKPAGSKSIISQISELSIRSKNETPEERRRRKGLVKEYRRERRMERKANTEAFKEEKIRQEKIMLNKKMKKKSTVLVKTSEQS